MVERGVIHHQNRSRLWPFPTVLKELLNEILKK
jgi:hypothetical protein